MQVCVHLWLILNEAKRPTRLLPCLIKGLVTTDWWEKMLTLVEKIATEVPCYVLRFDRSGNVVKKVTTTKT